MAAAAATRTLSRLPGHSRAAAGLVLRRAYTVEVIGAALLAGAGGHGARRVAAALGVPLG